jgi:hypothetical protein
MPISITNKDYINDYGTLPYYKANAGDSTQVELTFFETIRAESGIQSILSYNPSTKTITWASGNFLTEGFRVGDDIQIEVTDNTGAVIATSNVTINVCEPSYIIHSGTITWYDSAAGENVSITVTYKSPSNLKRNGLYLDINHVENATQGTEFSLIDGEVTRLTFDVTGTTTGSVINGIQTGLKSGQFIVVGNIEDLTTYPNDIREYKVTIGVVQSGIYDVTKFDFSNCLKLYFKFNWQRDFGDPNNQYQYILSDNADTGWYDEAFNTGVIDATLVQGINDLDYSIVNTGQIEIDSASSIIGFGASYVPTDDEYYKNQPFSQSELGMTNPTQSGTAPITLNGFTNPSGANYQIIFSNPNTIGTITTWDYEVTFDSDFVTFMDARGEGDRLFYIWAKYGNVNLLLFQEQLTKQEKPGDPLQMVVHDFVDHSENITDTLTTQNGFTGNTEDDVAFIGKFLVPINATIESVTASIEAYNSVSGESFILQSNLFDFGSVPQVFGYYPVDISQEVITTLPTTSVKRDALLVRDNSVDTITEYGIRIYVPFLYRWEYWIPQSNADGEFYPNQQTKNWVPYDNTANWNIRFKVSAIINGLESTFEDDITIKDYDSDANIDQQIKLYRDIDNSLVTVVVEGELHKVVATHTLTNGFYWNPADIWGMITIEPTESSPRWISSTIVPFDNDILNPLTPISGSFCSISFPSADVVRLECYFDSNKINLENGVKFTTKIKGCMIDPAFVKLLTDGSIKLTTDGLPKLLTF